MDFAPQKLGFIGFWKIILCINSGLAAIFMILLPISELLTQSSQVNLFGAELQGWSSVAVGLVITPLIFALMSLIQSLLLFFPFKLGAAILHKLQIIKN
jgi:hypothetical protein